MYTFEFMELTLLVLALFLPLLLRTCLAEDTHCVLLTNTLALLSLRGFLALCLAGAEGNEPCPAPAAPSRGSWRLPSGSSPPRVPSCAFPCEGSWRGRRCCGSLRTNPPKKSPACLALGGSAPSFHGLFLQEDAAVASKNKPRAESCCSPARGRMRTYLCGRAAWC